MVNLQRKRATFRGKSVERNTGTEEVERRKKVDWRAATVEWKQLVYHQHADPVETTIGLSSQILSFQTAGSCRYHACVA